MAGAYNKSENESEDAIEELVAAWYRVFQKRTSRQMRRDSFYSGGQYLYNVQKIIMRPDRSKI
jgi:hypothetical protein